MWKERHNFLCRRLPSITTNKRFLYALIEEMVFLNCPSTRWNNFTGYSAGWNIANENFMSGLKKHISDFKIRASYSEVGNINIGSYPYL
jgi:hypothetical protein